MSTYAQVSDVRGLAPSIAVTPSTLPSEGDVQGYLNMIEAEVDAVLGNLGYTTPVPSTATASRLLLRDMVATGALVKVLRARGLGVDTSLLDAADHIEKSFRDRMKSLQTSNNPFELPDAPKGELAVVKTPDQRSASFADEAYDDFDMEAPRVTRAQGF